MNQHVNQSVNSFAIYLNNLYAQLENLTLKIVKMQYLRIKYNEKIRQKTQQFNIKYDNITQMRESYIKYRAVLAIFILIVELIFAISKSVFRRLK